MASSFMAMVYATLKESGIDTSEMTPNEAVEKFNQLNGNDNLKEEEIENNKCFVEKIDINNKEQLKYKLEGYANKIIKDNKEHHVLIDKNGNVFETVGNENTVDSFSSKLDGAISLHNHLEDGSFGEDDFINFRNKINTNFICVTPKYTYTLKVLKEIDKPYNYFYINGMNYISEEANQNHNVMNFMQKEGYIRYEKTLRNP